MPYSKSKHGLRGKVIADNADDARRSGTPCEQHGGHAMLCVKFAQKLICRTRAHTRPSRTRAHTNTFTMFKLVAETAWHWQNSRPRRHWQNSRPHQTSRRTVPPAELALSAAAASSKGRDGALLLR